MELIENLLQLLVTFVGVAALGYLLPEKWATGVFSACCASTAALPSARSTGTLYLLLFDTTPTGFL